MADRTPPDDTWQALCVCGHTLDDHFPIGPIDQPDPNEPATVRVGPCDGEDQEAESLHMVPCVCEMFSLALIG